MINSDATYLYIDTDLVQYYVQGTELVDLGDWSPVVSYSRLQVVDYDGILYVALRSTMATPPTQPVSEDWSMLVLVRAIPVPVANAGSDYTARLLANQAKEVGQSGTYWAYVAYGIGTNALYYAGSAYSIAVAGTNAAASAISGANSAFSIAVDGTNLAQTAYVIAQAGTNLGTTALNTATAGLNVATAAFDIAVQGTNLAQTAYTIAQEGTNTGTAALTLAGAAFDIAVHGTNLAYTALQTAWAGTVIPPLSSLPDVSIPLPTVNQVLAFDGSLWVAKDSPSQVAPGAFTYFLDDIASGTLGYQSLTTTPSGNPEEFDTVVVGSGTPFAFIEGYVSPFLNRTRIDAGIWEFNVYAQTSVNGQSAVVVVDIYALSIAGVSTLLLSGTTPPITSDQPQLVTTIITAGSFDVSPTDKLVAVFYGSRSDPLTVTLGIYHSGSTHDSHFHTPLALAHNDLGGLQGGATDQFYHTTLDQHGAMLGSFGYPSAQNRYVTTEDNRVALGAVGTQIADEALALASSGTAGANQAFALAVTGTSAVITEQGTRSQEDQFLQNQITALSDSVVVNLGTEAGTRSQEDQFLQNQITVESGTRSQEDQFLQNQVDSILSAINVGFSGTFTLFLGQVQNGFTDTMLTVVNGIVTNQTAPKYLYTDANDYALGSISVFNNHSNSWGAANDGLVVIDLYGTGIKAEETFESYAVGTVNNIGTLTGGTYWTDSAVIIDSYFRIYGSESFESYTLGTVTTGTYAGTLDGGFGWAGTFVLISY